MAWELSETLELSFVLTAAKRALTLAVPTIWNHDQGSHFTSPQYTALLLAKEVRISMDGKGRALDNIFTERLWEFWDLPRAIRELLSIVKANSTYDVSYHKLPQGAM